MASKLLLLLLGLTIIAVAVGVQEAKESDATKLQHLKKARSLPLKKRMWIIGKRRKTVCLRRRPDGYHDLCYCHEGTVSYIRCDLTVQEAYPQYFTTSVYPRWQKPTVPAHLVNYRPTTVPFVTYAPYYYTFKPGSRPSSQEIEEKILAGHGANKNP